jgi:hypothetical protein
MYLYALEMIKAACYKVSLVYSQVGDCLYWGSTDSRVTSREHKIVQESTFFKKGLTENILSP